MLDRDGISIVLTTLIILVAAVALSAALVLFTTSFIDETSAIPALRTTAAHYWVNNTGNVAWGAASIRNSGDALIQINEIFVRGKIVPFGNWYFDANQNRVTLENSQKELFYPGNYNNGLLKDSAGSVDTGASIVDIDLDKQTGTTTDRIALSQASGPIKLETGERAIIYFKVPDNTIGPEDVGSSASMNITSNDPKALVQVTIAGV